VGHGCGPACVVGAEGDWEVGEDAGDWAGTDGVAITVTVCCGFGLPPLHAATAGRRQARLAQAAHRTRRGYAVIAGIFLSCYVRLEGPA